MKRAASRLTLFVLVALAATGMVLQTGSVPHAHAADGGLYNQEHNLTLFAGLAGHTILADASPTLAIDAVSTPLSPFVPELALPQLALSGDSRAPPLR